MEVNSTLLPARFFGVQHSGVSVHGWSRWKARISWSSRDERLWMADVCGLLTEWKWALVILMSDRYEVVLKRDSK
jgi:hypothetical protein